MGAKRGIAFSLAKINNKMRYKVQHFIIDLTNCFNAYQRAEKCQRFITSNCPASLFEV